MRTNFKHINVDAFKRVREDNNSFEMLCIALIIKANYVSSCVHDISIKKIMKLGKCGHNKAQRIFRAVINGESEFLKYDKEKNSLTAVSLHKVYKEIKRTRKGYYVRKFKSYLMPQCEQLSIRNLMKKLRSMAVVECIHNADVADKLKSKCKCLCSGQHLITLAQISSATGLAHPMQINRIMKGLCDNNIIKRNHDKPQLIKKNANEADLDYFQEKSVSMIYFLFKGNLFGQRINAYQIIDEKAHRMFANNIHSLGSKSNRGIGHNIIIEDEKVDFSFSNNSYAYALENDIRFSMFN